MVTFGPAVVSSGCLVVSGALLVTFGAEVVTGAFVVTFGLEVVGGFVGIVLGGAVAVGGGVKLSPALQLKDPNFNMTTLGGDW